jgi:hypothetical protein
MRDVGDLSEDDLALWVSDLEPEVMRGVFETVLPVDIWEEVRDDSDDKLRSVLFEALCKTRASQQKRGYK